MPGVGLPLTVRLGYFVRCSSSAKRRAASENHLVYVSADSFVRYRAVASRRTNASREGNHPESAFPAHDQSPQR